MSIGEPMSHNCNETATFSYTGWSRKVFSGNSVQVSASKDSGEIFSLGSDYKVYYWDVDEGVWKLLKYETEKIEEEEK